MTRTTLLLGVAALTLSTVPVAGAQQADDQQEEQESAIPGPIQIPNGTPTPSPAPSSGGIVAIPPSGSRSTGPGGIGPDSLRDFSLGGRTAAPRTTPAPAPAQTATRQPPTPVAPPSSPGAARETARAAQPQVNRTTGDVTPVAPSATRPGSGDRALTPVEVDKIPDTSLIPPPSGLTAPQSGVSSWPWLLALLGVIGAGLFAWRRRVAVADGSVAAIDTRAPSESTARPVPPQPTSPPQPAPRTASSPLPAGTVTTAALKPDLRIEVEPVRAVYAEDGFTLDYQLVIANHGEGEARRPTVRQDFLFASQTQASDYDAFLARPVDERDRPLPQSIPPGSEFRFDARAHLPLAKAMVVNLEGRQLLLPILALGVRHGGQAPAHKPDADGMWLIGRKGGGDGRMAPIRADKGPRVIRDVELKRQ